MSQLWWDSNPQPLNGLIWQSRSPMRHRACRHTRVGHMKIFLPGLCPSSWVSFAPSVHRNEGSSGLCGIDARFKNATALSGSPIQRRAKREAPLEFDTRITRQSLWPAKPQCHPAVARVNGVLSFKSSWRVVFKSTRSANAAAQRHTSAQLKAPLGFEPRISCLQDRRFDQLSHGALLDPAFFGSSWGVVCRPNRLRHWHYSAPPFAFRSRIEKPQSPRWCSSTPSKGTAEIRTQDLLFTKQTL